MGRGRMRLCTLALGLTGGVVAGALVVILALKPAPAPAQTPPPSSPGAPSTSEGAAPQTGPGYVGAEVCKTCHEEAYQKFSHTRMGRLFLHQARNTTEQLGCENCHGPGQAHVDQGGGRGVGGMISYAKNDPTPVEQRNQMCLHCHTKGNRVFWAGSAHDARDVACTSCHTVMEDKSPRHQLTKPTEIETCGTCHLQKRAATMRTSHMPLREGKMTCSSCHNPHGTVTPSLLKANSLMRPVAELWRDPADGALLLDRHGRARLRMDGGGRASIRVEGSEARILPFEEGLEVDRLPPATLNLSACRTPASRPPPAPAASSCAPRAAASAWSRWRACCSGRGCSRRSRRRAGWPDCPITRPRPSR